jgi:hypothetical protein
MDIKTLYEEEESHVIKAFWTEGHQDINDFTDNVEIQFDIEDKPINSKKVLHGWASTITDPDILGDFDYYLNFSRDQREDSQKVTYFFYS